MGNPAANDGEHVFLLFARERQAGLADPCFSQTDFPRLAIAPYYQRQFNAMDENAGNLHGGVRSGVMLVVRRPI